MSFLKPDLANIRLNAVSFITQRRLAPLVLAGVIVLLLAPGMLNIRVSYDIASWFLKSDPKLQQFQDFSTNFGKENKIFAVVESTQTLFTSQGLKDIRTITEVLRQLKYVKRVESLANYPWIEQGTPHPKVSGFLNFSKNRSPAEFEKLALEHQLIPGLVISRDGHAASFSIDLRKSYLFSPKAYEAVKKVFLDYEKRGYKVGFTGPAYWNDEFRRLSEQEMLMLSPLLLILLLLLFAFFFKSFLIATIPLLVSGLTIASTLGIAGKFGIDLSSLSIMAPPILLAICSADVVHLIVSYLESGNKNDPGVVSFNKNIQPTLLTTLTTSIAFFSLLTSEAAPLRTLGILCGLGTLLGWLYTFLLTIPLLNSLRPSTTHRRLPAFSRTFSEKLSLRVLRHAKVIRITFLALTIASLFLVAKTEINSNVFDYFSPSTEIYQTNDRILKKFGGLGGVEILIDRNSSKGILDKNFLTQLEGLQNWLEGQDHVNQVQSILDYIYPVQKAFESGINNSDIFPIDYEVLKERLLYFNLRVPSGLNYFHLMNAEQTQVRMSVFWNSQKSKQVEKNAHAIRAKMKTLGLRGYLTGREFLYHRLNKYVVHSFFTSIFLTVIFLSLIMMFFLGSKRLALISLLPNILPILVGGAVLRLFNISLDLGSVLIASVCLGVAIDDTIHFLFTFNRERKKTSNFESQLVETYKKSGLAITITTITLVLAFSVFSFANFVPNQNFGIFAAVVLSLAWLFDMVLLPTLLMQNGRSTKGSLSKSE